MRFYSYDRNKSIVNLSNSILKRFGIEPYHKTLSCIDNELSKKKKIVVCLFDGCGESIQNKHLSKNSCLISHQFCQISSTFPPTTVAATTALLTGKYPCETGWIGWTTYNRTTDEVLEMFTSRNYITHEPCKYSDVCRKLYPTKTIFELIKENNPNLFAENLSMYPVDKNGPKTIEEFFKAIDEKVSSFDEGFMYAYSLQPDDALHELGTDCKEIKDMVNLIDTCMNDLYSKHEDTLFICLADHSHLNVEPIFLNEYPDFNETIEGCFHIEARTAAFRIKEGKEKQFKKLAHKYFGKYFKIVSKKYLLKHSVFGSGDSIPGFKDMIGDYVLISTTNKLFVYNKEKEKNVLVSTHGGGLKTENIIRVSLFNNK